MALRDAEQVNQQDNIRSNNFGGINTTSSPLNLPESDSPDLLNLDIDLAGNLSKRPGTDIVLGFQDYGTVPAYYCYPLRTSLGYDFQVTKNDGHLEFNVAFNKQWGSVKSYLNVWQSGSGYCNTCLIPGTNPSLLLLNGQQQPVQVTFYEKTRTAVATSSTVWTWQNADKFAGAATNKPILFINGIPIPTTSISFSYDTATTALTATFPAGTLSVGIAYRIDVVLPIWQRWVGAIRYFGDRYYDTVSRFNITRADQNIAVPQPLRSDIDLVPGTDPINFPMRVYATARPTDVQVGPVRQPTTSAIYGFGDGSTYTPGTGNYVNPAPFFITYADKSATTDPVTLHILRYRELRFNSNQGIDAADLRVTVDGTLRTQSVTAPPNTNGSYYVCSTPGTFYGTTTGTATYLYFGVNEPIGVPPLAEVDLINTRVTAIGSAASTSLDPLVPGSCQPIYGLEQWTDPLNNIYPSIACIYQGRLALSGFRNDPQRVIFSRVSVSSNSTSFNYFQITDDLDGLATDPFDILVASSSLDDFIVALVDWGGFLFALSRRSVSRIGASGALASESVQVSYLSAQGLINPKAYARTENAIFYVSDSGVFNLNPREADGEYQAYEKSLKIRKVFGNLSPNAVSSTWLAYDRGKKNLVLGMPNTFDVPGLCSDILVFSTQRESWTRYAACGGFSSFYGYNFNDSITGTNFAMHTLVGNDMYVLTFNSARYTDFTSLAPNFTGTLLAIPPSATYARQAGNNGQPVTLRVARSITLTNSSQSIGDMPWLIPHISVVNYQVIEGALDITDSIERLPGGALWLDDINPGTITLSVRPQRLTALSFTSKSRYGTAPQNEVCIWRNNELLIQDTDYTLASNGSATLTTAATNESIEWGLAYPCYYVSPLFTYGDLGVLKRSKHLYLYFDNLSYQQKRSDGDYLNTVQANVAILYDSGLSGSTSWDIYGFNEVAWDDAYFDNPSPQEQGHPYALFKAPLTGIGYSHQVIVFSHDASAFKLAGYQIEVRPTGKTFKGRIK